MMNRILKMQHITYKNHQGVGMYKFGYSPLGKPWLSVYCYLIDDLLIDTAQRNCEKIVLQTFESKPINTILLTHWHEDHSGNTTSLAAQHQARVFAPEGTGPYLRKGFNILPYERFLFGEIIPFTGEITIVSEDIFTENYQLTPVFTPGHATDHTVYVEQNKGWLFAGDLFVGVQIKVFRKAEKFWQQLDSFKKIITYDFDTLFCGHHPRLFDGKAWMQQKIDYFEDFGGQVRAFQQKGLLPKEIMKAMKLRENHLLRLLLSDDVSLMHMITAACEER